MGRVVEMWARFLLIIREGYVSARDVMILHPFSVRHMAQWETGNREDAAGDSFSGLGSRPSGIRFRSSGSGAGPGNVFPTANRSPLTPVMGRGATAWRPWADGGCGVR